MRSGTRRSTRALIAMIAVVGVCATIASGVASAASLGADTAVARAGVLVASDLPAGFQESATSTTSHADNIRLAKGVDGCAPYVTLQKMLTLLPQVRSSRYGNGTHTLGNEVDVFPSERSATTALTLYARPSVVGCLENLLEKQARQDPGSRGSLDDVVVSLDRQDIAGLGDDRVVYEGTMAVTGTDGSSTQVGIGSAAVRVGRTLDVVTYTTTGEGLIDVLAPAIDGSVGRLRTALAKGGA